MEYAVSDDNRTLRTVATLENQSAQQTEGPFTQRFAANLVADDGSLPARSREEHYHDPGLA